MAKYYGAIGYSETVQESEGSDIWVGKITERNYYGELTRNTSKFQTSDSVNDDTNINTEISIVADPYAIQNFRYMRYIEFMGTRWKINAVEVKYPRLILSIGGVYNGESLDTEE